LKKSLKKTASVMLAAMLGLAGYSTVSAAGTPVKVVLDGEVLAFSVDPIEAGNHTYVEFRTLMAKLGYQVDYDIATRTAKATSPQRQIEIALDQDTVLVDGNPVDGRDQIRLVNGRTMVELQLAATLAGAEADWDGATRTATIRRWPAEEEKAVRDVFNKLLLVEAAGDGQGLFGLYTSDSPVDVEWLASDYEKVRTKTTFEELVIESISDTEAVVRVKEVAVKISGGFFPDHQAELRYLLHKEDGQWKIHDYEVLDEALLDPDGLFDQAVEVPDEVESGLAAMLQAQYQAANEENVEAYTEMFIYESEEAKEASKARLRALAEQWDAVFSLDRWAIVEFNGSDEAAIVFSEIREVKTEDGPYKSKFIYLAYVKKIDGKWLMESGIYELYHETIE